MVYIQVLTIISGPYPADSIDTSSCSLRHHSRYTSGLRIDMKQGNYRKSIGRQYPNIRDHQDFTMFYLPSFDGSPKMIFPSTTRSEPLNRRLSHKKSSRVETNCAAFR